MDARSAGSSCWSTPRRSADSVSRIHVVNSTFAERPGRSGQTVRTCGASSFFPCLWYHSRRKQVKKQSLFSWIFWPKSERRICAESRKNCALCKKLTECFCFFLRRMCVLTSLFPGSNKGTGPGILRALKYTAEGGVFCISDNRPFLSKLGTVRGIVKGDSFS